MTALQIVSLVVGLLLALVYFVAFTRSMKWLIERGERKPAVFVISIAARQLVLGCVIALLWLVGLDVIAILIGVCVGTVLSRLRVISMFRKPKNSSAER